MSGLNIQIERIHLITNHKVNYSPIRYLLLFDIEGSRGRTSFLGK